MAVDEHFRHRLHQKLEEVLGPEEAGILMDHLPPRGFGDLATKGDLELMRAATKADIDALRAATKSDIDALRVSTKSDLHAVRADFDVLRADFGVLRHEVEGAMDRAVRSVVQWTSSTVLVGIGLAIAAARLI